MNEVKVNKAKKFSRLFWKRRHYDVNGQEKRGGDNPSPKLQTILSIAIEVKKYFSGARKRVF